MVTWVQQNKSTTQTCIHFIVYTYCPYVCTSSPHWTPPSRLHPGLPGTSPSVCLAVWLSWLDRGAGPGNVANVTPMTIYLKPVCWAVFPPKPISPWIKPITSCWHMKTLQCHISSARPHKTFPFLLWYNIVLWKIYNMSYSFEVVYISKEMTSQLPFTDCKSIIWNIWRINSNPLVMFDTNIIFRFSMIMDDTHRFSGLFCLPRLATSTLSLLY